MTSENGISLRIITRRIHFCMCVCSLSLSLSEAQAIPQGKFPRSSSGLKCSGLRLPQWLLLDLDHAYRPVQFEYTHL